MPAATTTDSTPARHRPKSYTVFAAAFLAGAAAAVGVNRVLDVQVAQRRPQVECEPIFVALRALPQGSPVTVWDVALKDWPKAMLPGSALRAGDAFEGFVLRHAIREGQPLLAVQLVRSGTGEGQTATEAFVPAVPAAASTTAAADLWTPGEPVPASPAAVSASPAIPVASAPADFATSSTPEAVVPAAPPAPETLANDATTAAAEAVPEPRQDAVAADDAPVAESPAAEPPATPSDEPTVAAGPAPTEPTVVAVPAETPTPAATAVAAQPTAAMPSDDDASEAVATDVSSMPSVMAAPSTGGPAATRPTANDAGRFLVVPERIALQADTSFTTPRPQPPGPPAAAGTSTAQARPRTPPRPTAPRSGQTATPKRPAQANGQQPRQPAQPAPRSGPTPSAAKGWGGMFPNVAAGIDAIGGQWQRMRSTAGQPQRGDQPISR